MTSAYWIILLALFPLIGGCYAWWRCETIVLWEWAVGVVAAIAIGAATFATANAIISHDTEIRSGYVEQACHIPKWHAEWTETETYTDDEGKEHTRTVTKTETHYPKWWVETTIGKINIDESKFEEIKSRFGVRKEWGSRPDYDWGDRYDYFSDVTNPSADKAAYPVSDSFSWANPFLGTNTIKLGKEVSEDEARKIGLVDYPSISDHFSSNRVIGTNKVSTHKWDQMCTELGATWKVNLTLINFGDTPISVAVKQRDYWRNGKKNDLVLCYGNDWAYVFGWAKSDLVKKELETLLLENEVNNDLLPKIAQVVKRDFQPYEWRKEEEISRPVPTGAVIAAFLVMAASQFGIGYWFHHNEFAKGRTGLGLGRRWQFSPTIYR